MTKLLVLLAVAAMTVSAFAFENTATYSGGPVGFTSTVWNGSGWVGINPTIDSLTVDATVATIGTYSLDNTKIHFNIEKLGEPVTGTLHGSFTTNKPGYFVMYMAGVGPTGGPCVMNNMSSGTNDMPVTWSGNSGFNFRLTDGNSAVTSDIFPIGPTAFTVTCTAVVGATQPAGNYVLDPTIEIKAAL